MSYTKVSRSSLFEAETDENIASDYVPIDLEIVEVNNEEAEEESKTQEADEFDFPLFSFGAVASSGDKNAESEASDNKEKGADEQEENRPLKAKVMKVSLKHDEPEENIRLERPQEYYFFQATNEQRSQFESVAVSGEQIIERSSEEPGSAKRGKVVDVAVHNAQVDRENNMKKRRPGKNQRRAKIEARHRKLERQKIVEELKRQQEKKLLKKRFHKRGGKKNKKKAAGVPGASGAPASGTPVAV